MRLAILVTIFVTVVPSFGEVRLAPNCAPGLHGDAAEFAVAEGKISNYSLHHHFEIRDDRNDFFIDADLHDGVLELDIELVDFRKQIRSSMSGSDLFSQMIIYYGVQNIRIIHAHWVSKTNFEGFQRGLASGLTKEEAAKNTWTGRQAGKYGFIVPKNFTYPKSVSNPLVSYVDVDFMRF